MADLSNVVRMLIHQLDATRSYLLPGYCDEDEKARAVIAFAESALAAEPPAPAPAPDDEREELAQWLERIGDDYDDLYRPPSALIRPKLARAAALLREARLQSVPVADRPWERPGWCDAEGRCCWLAPNQSWPCLYLMKVDSALAAQVATHCLPHWFIPIPIPQPPQANTTHPTPHGAPDR